MGSAQIMSRTYIVSAIITIFIVIVLGTVIGLMSYLQNGTDHICLPET